MDCGVTARGPTGGLSEKIRMINGAYQNTSRTTTAESVADCLALCVTPQTKVGISVHEHFPVYGTVGVVAADAALTQCVMLEDNRQRLFAVTLRAAFIEPSHRESAGGFENVAPVRIVALHAIHVAFDHRMVLRQMKFRLDVEMTLETGRRVLAGVDYEFAATTTRLHVQAARAVTGFASALAGHRRAFKMHSRMRAGRKDADVIRVAFGANVVADVGCSRYFRRSENISGHAGTRTQQQHNAARQDKSGHSDPCLPLLHIRFITISSRLTIQNQRASMIYPANGLRACHSRCG